MGDDLKQNVQDSFNNSTGWNSNPIPKFAKMGVDAVKQALNIRQQKLNAMKQDYGTDSKATD